MFHINDHGKLSKALDIVPNGNAKVILEMAKSLSLEDNLQRQVLIIYPNLYADNNTGRK